MRAPITHRNKLIVAAREIWEETQDKDLSFSKLGELFGIKKETVFEIYNRDKEKFSIRSLFAEAKKKSKKLSTKKLADR